MAQRVKLLAQTAVPCDGAHGNQQDTFRDSRRDATLPGCLGSPAWHLEHHLPHLLSNGPRPSATQAPGHPRACSPATAWSQAPSDLRSRWGGAGQILMPLPFALQTKKYADVIIPRGVDNMGKQQARGCPSTLLPEPPQGLALSQRGHRGPSALTRRRTP